MNRKNVSIIVTTYNSSSYVAETLESIVAQTYKDYEVVIIDDCSADDTVRILEDCIKDKSNWKLYRNTENRGVAFSRNRGFDLATGEYIAILDSDDIWKPQKLEKQVLFMNANSLDLCCTSYTYFSKSPDDGTYDYMTQDAITYDALLKENLIGCSTVLFRRRITYDYRMNQDIFHEDYAFWLKILKAGHKVKGMREPLVYYRFRNSGRSYDKTNSAKQRFSILYTQEKLGLARSLYYMTYYWVNAVVKYARIFGYLK